MCTAPLKFPAPLKLRPYTNLFIIIITKTVSWPGGSRAYGFGETSQMEKNSCWWPVYLGYISATNLWSLAALWGVMYFRFCGWRHVCPQCKGDVESLTGWREVEPIGEAWSTESVGASVDWNWIIHWNNFTGDRGVDTLTMQCTQWMTGADMTGGWPSSTDWPISSGFRHALQKM